MVEPVHEQGVGGGWDGGGWEPGGWRTGGCRVGRSREECGHSYLQEKRPTKSLFKQLGFCRGSGG